MSAVRPLPPRPSLEYERKEAKALLRRLRAGDPDALARARAHHPQLDAADPARIRLADAQLVAAREYGFASWPRLVRYFGDVERQRDARVQLHGGRRLVDGRVRHLLAGHGARDPLAGRALAAYVPRFYGTRVEDVFASPITEDDARLTTARMYGAPSWEVLLERVTAVRPWPGPFDPDPLRDAREAMAAGDLEALDRIVTAHPALLHPSGHEASANRTLIGAALGLEQLRGADAMGPVMRWLAARGFDRQRGLNRRLCGRVGMTVDQVRDLLDRGADPAWVAPNGIPVLEHALLRYWNGDAVDLVAARVTPRRALWIAAGLGDVDGVRRLLGRDGKPTPAARLLRPDFDAAGVRPGMPALPDADDEELLVEALFVAMLNGRTATMEYLAARGAPVNSLVYGGPILGIAVGNAMTASVECLVRCGADLDLYDRNQGQTARELARGPFEDAPHDPARRRILELCGLDPDVVLAARDARPAEPPVRLPVFEEALALAADDAARLGLPNVGPENLLVGLARGDGTPLSVLREAGGMDVARFRAELGDRLRPAAHRVDGPAPPMGADAQAAVDLAVALATEQRGYAVTSLHLTAALLRTGDGRPAALVARCGASLDALRATEARWMAGFAVR